MSQDKMEDTKRLHGGGQDRKLDPERSEPNVPKAVLPASAAKPEPLAPVKAQIAEGEEDRRRLWLRVTDLGVRLEHSKTNTIIAIVASAMLVFIPLIVLVSRQQTDFDEHLAAQRKTNGAYQGAIEQMVMDENEYRDATARETQNLRFALERLVADAEKDHKTIAELRVKLEESSKHADVVVEDPPEQKVKRTAEVPAWPPKPSTLAELRQYDGERIMAYTFPAEGGHTITVDHLPYAYGNRVPVELRVSREHFKILFYGNGVLDVQALEDAHRNR